MIFLLNSTSTEPDIENCQIVDFAKGRDEDEAFKSLTKENDYLLDTNFNRLGFNSPQLCCDQLVCFRE
jgi:hypothetical protein